MQALGFEPRHQAWKACILTRLDDACPASRCGTSALILFEKDVVDEGGKPIAPVDPWDGMRALPRFVLVLGVKVHRASEARVDLFPAARVARACMVEENRRLRVNHQTKARPRGV